MFEARIGSRAAVAAGILAFALAASLAEPALAAKPTSKDAEALKIEQKAMRFFANGDVGGAAANLKLALLKCDPDACSPSTMARLHVSLGTVRGSGDGDYATAKKEFVTALGIDPKARLRPPTTPKLTATFDDARAEASGGKAPDTSNPPPPQPSPPQPTPPPPVQEKPPEKQNSLSGLFNNDEPPPPPKKVEPPPGESSPEPRRSWLSFRPHFEFAYLKDANICSPKAPRGYYCTAEDGKFYRGTPQPNSEISSGFAFSALRLVLGYERVLFGGFTLGGFAGYAIRNGTPDGRKSAFPANFEARAMYTFGDNPYADDEGRIQPFVFLTVGAADFDTHVKIRVNELPCGNAITNTCQRELDAYHLVGGVYSTLGGGARWQFAGRHALRAGVRATILFSSGNFYAAPELGYEFGL